MSRSYIDKLFIGWCQSISEHIDPEIFIHIYENYQTIYIVRINTALKSITSQLHEKNPNVSFYPRGRVKSKLSYYNKTFLKLVENIERLFSTMLSQDKREALIEKYFGNISDKSLYSKLRLDILNATDPGINHFEIINNIFSQLSPRDLRIVLLQLGQTQDMFAYKIVIRDSMQKPNFTIQSCSYEKKKLSYKIIPTTENAAPIYISPSIKLSPSNIITKDNGIKYVVINGEEFELNEQNLLYPDSISVKKRQLANATRDKTGNVTLLRDYFLLPNGEIFYIDKIIKTENGYFVKFGDETRNLDTLLNKGTPLCKNDNQTLANVSSQIEDILNSVFSENGFQQIKSRRKNYYKNKKPSGYGNAIHDSFYGGYGLFLEGQIIAESTEEYYHKSTNENESTNKIDNRDHDMYKQQKIEQMAEQIPFIANIVKNDKFALQTSSIAIKELLIAHPEIPIQDVLPRYIVPVLTSNQVEIVDFFDLKYPDGIKYTFGYFFAQVIDEEFTYEKYLSAYTKANDYPYTLDSPLATEAEEIPIY